MATKDHKLRNVGWEGEMSTDVAGTRYRSGVKGKGGTTRMKRLIEALGRVVSIDEDAIFKSKEWPHMWRKK